MNNYLFQAIKLFDEKCPRGNHTDFVNFLVWWIVMEDYLKLMSREPDATKALSEISHNERLQGIIQTAWSRISIQSWAGTIDVIMNSEQYKKCSYRITNSKSPDLVQLLRVIYYVRGELIHGKDQPLNDGNIILYQCCANILAQWVKYLA